MAKDKSPKASSNWFLNRNVSLSFKCTRSISTSSSSAVTSPSPISSPRTPPNKPSRESELKEVFRRFDGDGDEKISAIELRSFFGSIGEYLSHEDAESVIEELDSDGDKLLDFSDFMKLMKREFRAEYEKEEEEDLRRAFEMFEMEKGSGCITPKGLQRMFHRLGDVKSYDECVAMINVFDIDGNGVLDFHEFYQMMA
ncbi:probable calcium-binding protein CML41 [Euphorbia lathyris]|uniref:probable calcium-binding protein CML41 n=1 Tax=Euphorbia lathyris TaxID=212925 RepID=UPI0033137A8D